MEDGDREIVFRFEAQRVGELAVINGDEEFRRNYRRGPAAFEMWPEHLVGRLLAARLDPLPSGEERERPGDTLRVFGLGRKAWAIGQSITHRN